jgi:hypothetical protein
MKLSCLATVSITSTLSVLFLQFSTPSVNASILREQQTLQSNSVLLSQFFPNEWGEQYETQQEPNVVILGNNEHHPAASSEVSSHSKLLK